MNEYDIDECRAILVQVEERSGEEYPNLVAGALTLERLRRWTNQHSDGWMYWQKPSKAAARLISHLDNIKSRYIRDELVDLTDAELQAAYRPIKAFLTRQKVDHDVIFPPPKAEVIAEALSFEEIAEAQGWNEQSLIDVLYGYIATVGQQENLAQYAANIANEENA